MKRLQDPILYVGSAEPVGISGLTFLSSDAVQRRSHLMAGESEGNFQVASIRLMPFAPNCTLDYPIRMLLCLLLSAAS